MPPTHVAGRRNSAVRVVRSPSALATVFLLSMSMSACSAYSGEGITHSVRPGENLYRIGQAYGIPYRELARVNDLGSPYRIEVGDRLFIPKADRQLPVTLITPRAVSAAPPADSEIVRPRGPLFRPDGRVGSSGFGWPVGGRVTSGFGRRARGHHDGIDIVASDGSPVHAARDGTVIFADRLSGYGNVLIVEHSDDFTTVYAHNRSNLVRKGTRVRRGQVIATVGDTGRASTSHLHFEVRKQNVARNPLYYLPGGSSASVAAAQ